MSGRTTHWSLIDAARGGDQQAQSALVARYRPVVRRYLETRGLGADAEDVAQSVFVRLLVDGAIRKTDPARGGFRSFLFALTRHALGHYLRRGRALKRGGDVEHVPLADHDPAPARERDAFDREWLLHLVEQAMRRLSEEHPNYFQALQGFLWEELSQPQLAERLGLKTADVRNYVHRGRRKLHSYLSEEIALYEQDPRLHRTEVELLARLLEPKSG